MVSVISVVSTQILLALAFGVWEWTAAWSNVFAVGLSAIPGYYLNRAWAWGKRGRSHFMKEVLPFWVMAFIGLLLSTLFVGIAEDRALEYESRLLQTAVINGASVLAFGILWVAKFAVLNKILFAHHEEDLPPALDGRTGIPT
jgi:putative flippase GtrA